MTKKVITLIDELGTLRAEKKRIEFEEEKALEEIKKQGLDIGTHFGATYALEVSERANTSIDPEGAFKLLKKEQFFKVISITKAKIEKYLLPAQIDKITKELPASRVYKTTAISGR